MIRKYSGILIMTLFVGVLLIVFIMAPKSYDWNVSFSHDDYQPFGCAVFDSVMSSTLPEGYEVVDISTPNPDPKTSAIIYTKEQIDSPYQYVTDTAFFKAEFEREKKLMNFVRNGGVLILATSEINDFFVSGMKTYGFEDKGQTHSSENDKWNFEHLVDQCREYKHYRIEAKWEPDGTTYKVQPFMLCYHKMADYYKEGSFRPLLSYYDKDADAIFTVAYSKRIGKGLVEYVSVPHFFTNYGVMDKNASLITSHLLQPVAGRHVVRITGDDEEMKENGPSENTGEMSYLLSRPALKWALYLAMTVLVIFCVFTMRRKMRAIPLPVETTNSTFEFAKYMGTYYFARHQHTKPVIAKYKGLKQELSDYYGWDVDNMSNQELADGIASKTGEQPDKVIKLIRAVNSLSHNHRIDQKTMMELIDYISLLKNKL